METSNSTQRGHAYKSVVNGDGVESMYKICDRPWYSTLLSVHALEQITLQSTIFHIRSSPIYHTTFQANIHPRLSTPNRSPRTTITMCNRVMHILGCGCTSKVWHSYTRKCENYCNGKACLNGGPSAENDEIENWPESICADHRKIDNEGMKAGKPTRFPGATDTEL